ncbi:MAG: hypothetical protein ACFFCW_13635 [Candidatus Hodarchaeota archaeon]
MCQVSLQEGHLYMKDSPDWKELEIKFYSDTGVFLCNSCKHEICVQLQRSEHSFHDVLVKIYCVCGGRYMFERYVYD